MKQLIYNIKYYFTKVNEKHTLKGCISFIKSVM